MAEGVISQFETGVEPHVEGFDAFVDFTPFVELAFIDEAHHRDLLLPQGGEQFRGHLRDGRGGHGIRGAGRQVVNGDGDLAIRRSSGPGIRGSPHHAESKHSEQAGQQRLHDGSPPARHASGNELSLAPSAIYRKSARHCTWSWLRFGG